MGTKTPREIFPRPPSTWRKRPRKGATGRGPIAEPPAAPVPPGMLQEGAAKEPLAAKPVVSLLPPGKPGRVGAAGPERSAPSRRRCSVPGSHVPPAPGPPQPPSERPKRQRLKELAERLASPAEQEQLYAAQALGCLGSAEQFVLAALLNALRGCCKAPVRYEVTRTLVRLGEPGPSHTIAPAPGGGQEPALRAAGGSACPLHPSVTRRLRGAFTGHGAARGPQPQASAGGTRGAAPTPPRRARCGGTEAADAGYPCPPRWAGRRLPGDGGGGGAARAPAAGRPRAEGGLAAGAERGPARPRRRPRAPGTAVAHAGQPRAGVLHPAAILLCTQRSPVGAQPQLTRALERLAAAPGPAAAVLAAAACLGYLDASDATARETLLRCLAQGSPREKAKVPLSVRCRLRPVLPPARRSRREAAAERRLPRPLPSAAMRRRPGGFGASCGAPQPSPAPSPWLGGSVRAAEGSPPGPSPSPQALHVLIQHMKVASAAVLRALLDQLRRSPACEHRAGAAALLRLLGPEPVRRERLEDEVLAALLERLHAEPLLAVRRSVALAVEALQMKAQIWGVLEKQLQAKHHLVRKQAVVSLGVLGLRSESVLFTLLDMLELDRSREVRLEVSAGPGRWASGSRDPAVPPLPKAGHQDAVQAGSERETPAGAPAAPAGGSRQGACGSLAELGETPWGWGTTEPPSLRYPAGSAGGLSATGTWCGAGAEELKRFSAMDLAFPLLREEHPTSGMPGGAVRATHAFP
ncbi:protein HEATR9 [Struthio camelus]|uniref:protein HEATR9 n=1 Tax=Struthio camelus TaxID=8801 RepID=UPI003603FBBB